MRGYMLLLNAWRVPDGPYCKQERRGVSAPLEHAEQAAYFKWWRKYAELKGLSPKLCFAIPNAGRLSDGARIYMWREGLTAGVLDIFMAIPRGGYCGMFLEMKRVGRKPSAEQVEFGKAVDGQGYLTGVCYSAHEAITATEKYLNGSIRRP
jgi:hypothetical protein